MKYDTSSVPLDIIENQFEINIPCIQTLLFNYVFVKSNSYLYLSTYQSGYKTFVLKDSQKPFVRHLTTTFLYYLEVS